MRVYSQVTIGVLSDARVIGDFDFFLWVYMDFLNFLQWIWLQWQEKNSVTNYVKKKKWGREAVEEVLWSGSKKSPTNTAETPTGRLPLLLAYLSGSDCAGGLVQPFLAGSSGFERFPVGSKQAGWGLPLAGCCPQRWPRSHKGLWALPSTYFCPLQGVLLPISPPLLISRSFLSFLAESNEMTYLEVLYTL